MGYYDSTDIPFYYYLANTFTLADRYFGAAMGGDVLGALLELKDWLRPGPGRRSKRVSVPCL